MFSTAEFSAAMWSSTVWWNRARSGPGRGRRAPSPGRGSRAGARAPWRGCTRTLPHLPGDGEHVALVEIVVGVQHGGRDDARRGGVMNRSVYRRGAWSACRRNSSHSFVVRLDHRTQLGHGLGGVEHLRLSCRGLPAWHKSGKSTSRGASAASLAAEPPHALGPHRSGSRRVAARRCCRRRRRTRPAARPRGAPRPPPAARARRCPGLGPVLCRTSRSVRTGGRGRLPTWVVRMRASLLCMGQASSLRRARSSAASMPPVSAPASTSARLINGRTT